MYQLLLAPIVWKVLGALAILCSVFYGGVSWEHNRLVERQAAISAKQLSDYKKNVALAVENSKALNETLAENIANDLKTQVQVKDEALKRVRQQLLKIERQANAKWSLPTRPENAIPGDVQQTTCVDASAYRFDLGTVRLFNNARANMPAADPAIGSDEESRASSTIGIEAFVENDLEIVRLYNELAKRHNVLVDYISQKQKEQLDAQADR